MGKKLIDIINLRGEAALAIAGEVSAYSQSFDVPSDATGFVFEYKAASEGTVNLKLELEQGNEAPTTEGAVDAAHFCVPDDAEDINSALTDENLHMKAIALTATAKARIKITGLTGNDASTAMSVLRLHYTK